MNERRIRFNVVTDDIQRSISLYKDALGLTMRPICNPIAMFPLGEAEFVVCHRETAKELLGFEFGERPNGLLICLEFDSQRELEKAESAALQCGAVPCPEMNTLQERCILDFNGVNWQLACRNHSN